MATTDTGEAPQELPEVQLPVLEPREDEGQVILAHRIELDPTAKQREYFAQAAGTARFVFNWALAEWDTQYKLGGKPKAADIRRYFNSIYKEHFPWMTELHRDAHSQPFANLRSAYQRYFNGLTKGYRVNRPKFKKKGKCRDSFYVANDRLTIKGLTVRLPVIGIIRMREELRFSGKVMGATVLRFADRWFISVKVDTDFATQPTPIGDPIGVDLGLTTFAVMSDGRRVDSPKPLKRAQRKLRRLNRWMSRKKLKSKNSSKAAMKLARQHRKVANVRADFLHKLTTRLATEHSEICIEDLNVSGMSKNHTLAGAIKDASWGEFRRQLEYKTVLYGSRLTVRDRWFPSSKLCSVCGEKADAMPLSMREWVCRGCGTVHDRDQNAAMNILNGSSVGYTRSYACGDGSAGTQTDGCETAVVEAGTTLVGALVLAP